MLITDTAELGQGGQLPNYTSYYQAVLGVLIVLCVLFLQGGLLRDKATRGFDAPGKPPIQKEEVS